MRDTRILGLLIGFSLSVGAFSPLASAQDYSPYVAHELPNRVLWGVAHVHTGYSFDAGMFGIALTPDDLFNVSRGGEVVTDNGMRFKQDRPLDWVSITGVDPVPWTPEHLGSRSSRWPRDITGPTRRS